MVLLDAVEHGRAVREHLPERLRAHVLVYILLSWFRLPYSLRPVQRFLYDVCEPYLRVLAPPAAVLRFGPFDFSPIVAHPRRSIVARLSWSCLARLH